MEFDDSPSEILAKAEFELVKTRFRIALIKQARDGQNKLRYIGVPIHLELARLIVWKRLIKSFLKDNFPDNTWDSDVEEN